MQVKLVNVLIERDMVTKIQAAVPVHEIEILYSVFGEGNVEVSHDPAGVMELESPAGEWERLLVKYGADEGGKPLAASVYPTQKDFADAVAAGAAEDKPKPKAGA